MQFEQVTPESYPVNLINKDWTARKLYVVGSAKCFPAMVHNMEVLEDDVWIVTNPKSGTTWMQELVWLLMNDCDFEAALAKDLELRSPFLEYDTMDNENKETLLKHVVEHPSPRVVKTHLSLALLPVQLWQKKAKVIYVFRNPKDAWVSAYYHCITLGLIHDTTMKDFIDDFLENEIDNMEYVTHASEFYQLRNEPWVYYTSFEQMKANLRGVIEDLCKFLSKTVTEQQMEQLLKHLSFEEMKKNPTTNHYWEIAQSMHRNKSKEVHNFLRSGKVNGYKEELTPEQIKKGDLLISQSLQKNQVTLEELLLLDKK